MAQEGKVYKNLKVPGDIHKRIKGSAFREGLTIMVYIPRLFQRYDKMAAFVKLAATGDYQCADSKQKGVCTHKSCELARQAVALLKEL